MSGPDGFPAADVVLPINSTVRSTLLGTPTMPQAFPLLGNADFEQGCAGLLHKFQQIRSLQDEWLSMDKMCRNDTALLRITKPLITRGVHCGTNARDVIGEDPAEAVEDDEEALTETAVVPAIITYDAIVSPVYRVPVLYFYIQDSLHRYPPTMTTLYEHLVVPHFRPQTQNTGVLGGITIADHPVTNRPVFLIHPCQTAQVMEAAIHNDTTPEQYLIAWIGALGKPVGLNVPLALAKNCE